MRFKHLHVCIFMIDANTWASIGAHVSCRVINRTVADYGTGQSVILFQEHINKKQLL